ncbi:MAG: MFS transporter [Promethearchaeota archaeon]
MEKEKLPRKEIFTYALGSIPNTLLAGVFMLMYVNFFWNFLGLNLTLFIIGQVIYATINALNDPITGHLSDKTNIDKWGSRRLIYIKYAGPIWAVFYFLMWFPWDYSNQFIIFLHFVISICVFDTFLSLVIGLYMSLMSEMTDSIKIRYKLSFYSNIVMILAGIPVIFAQTLFDISLQTFQIFNGIIAMISIIMYIVVTRKLKERPELRIEENYSLFQAMKAILKSKAFLTRTGYIFFGNVAKAMGFSFLFAFILILGSGPLIPILFMFVTYGVGFLSQIIYMKTENKWGIRKTILVLKSFLIITNLISFAIVLSIDSTPIVWICIAIVSIFTGFNVFDFVLLTLAIDEDEIKRGSRRESIFQGTSSLIFKPADSLGPIIATIILTAYGFITGSTTQDATAIIGIKFILFVAPAIVHAISLIFIYFFPYHGETLEKLRVDLLELHAKKKEDYELGKGYKYGNENQ